jgi:hypothetical protein
MNHTYAQSGRVAGVIDLKLSIEYYCCPMHVARDTQRGHRPAPVLHDIMSTCRDRAGVDAAGGVMDAQQQCQEKVLAAAEVRPCRRRTSREYR